MSRRHGRGWSGLPAAGLLVLALPARADLVLIEDGVCRVPIVVAAGAPAETVRAAEELAGYLGKIGGARPEVRTNGCGEAPGSAVWVGLQPGLAERFPGIALAFEQPEEILMACTGRDLLLAGRDRLFGNVQLEYGTANAVYSFLQKYLGVRWLWPGPLGEDVPQNKTLALAPCEARFHPPFLMRGVFLRPGGSLLEWSRRQRVALDSLNMDIGHAFDDWWDRYHAAHPDYFALQPDGTRSGYPSPDNAKLCEANSNVWAQWWADAAETLRRDPTATVLGAAPNDGSNAGLCVCDACKAWDHPGGRPWKMSWNGLSQEYVAMTDRYVTFWNILARGLKDRFPGRDLYVSGMAYGPARPPPLGVTLEPNIVIGYVGHFPLAGEAVRAAEKEEWRQWSDKAPKLMFRPNLFWYSGGFHGLPTLAVRNTMEDFRFLAEHSGFGLAIDSTPQHWATQGPQYYVMAQFAWDPLQDGAALLDDYYRRGFGPAAAPVRRYFELMEEAHTAILNTPGWRHSMGVIKSPLTECILEQYNPDRLARAAALLDEAQAAAADGPAVCRERVAFVRNGLDYTRVFMETLEAMAAVRASGGRDRAVVEKAQALCAAREAFFQAYDGIAFNRHLFAVTWAQSRGLEDIVGPPSETFLRAAGLRAVYRWTGRQGDSLWASAGNWECEDGAAWTPAAEPPGAGACVVLGDATADDRPQRLLLTRDTTVARLVMAAGGRRAYTIASREDAAEEMLDSDSGMLYGLRLADARPLEQAESAAQTLALQVETRLTADEKPVALLASTNGAAVRLERALKAERGLAVRGGAAGAGLLEWRQRPALAGLELAAGARVFWNAPGDAGFDSLRATSGTVFAARSTALANGVYLFGGTAAFGPLGAGTADVALAVGSVTRGGRLLLQAPADGSTGRLILRVDTIDSRAGNLPAPAIHTEAGTCVDLGGDQPGPMRADLAAGIHGAGGLIKTPDGTQRRGARPVSLVGERNTYTGGTFLQGGTLRLDRSVIPADGTVGGASQVDYAGCLGPGPLHLAAGAVFDLNGLTQAVAALRGAGTVLLNGGTLEIAAPETGAFTGRVQGPGTVVEGGVRVHGH